MDLDLYTDRLSLRPLALDDVDLGITLFTDENVCRYIGGVQTEEEIRELMPTYISRCCGGCIGVWCVRDRVTEEKLGTGVLLPMPVNEDDTDWSLVAGPHLPDAEIEIGYILKPAAWGKGFATEICLRLLEFAFSQSPMQDVVACIDDRNSASRNVLLKSGMTEEGMVRAYNTDAPGFRITRDQWLANQNA